MDAEDVTASEAILVQILKNQMAIVAALDALLDETNTHKNDARNMLALVSIQSATLAGETENGK